MKVLSACRKIRKWFGRAKALSLLRLNGNICPDGQTISEQMGEQDGGSTPPISTNHKTYLTTFEL